MNTDIPQLEPADLDAVDLPEGAVLQGADMPKPAEYLSARQKNGVPRGYASGNSPMGVDEIYRETWLWLKQRGCENLVNKRLLESYAQAFARYIQCEDAISSYGLLGKHPATGGVVVSPFVQMSQQFQKTANMLWYEIYEVVKQNCTEKPVPLLAYLIQKSSMSSTLVLDPFGDSTLRAFPAFVVVKNKG